MSDLLLAFLERVLVKVHSDELPSEIRVCPTQLFEGREIPQLAVLTQPVKTERMRIQVLAERIIAAIDADVQTRKGQQLYLVMAITKDGGSIAAAHREMRIGKFTEGAEIASAISNMNMLQEAQKGVFTGVTDWMKEMRQQTAFIIGQATGINVRLEKQSDALLEGLLKSRGYESDMFNANLHLRAEAMGFGGNNEEHGSTLERLRVQMAGLKEVAAPLLRSLEPSLKAVAGAYAESVKGRGASFHGETNGQKSTGSAPPGGETVGAAVSEDATISSDVDIAIGKLRKSFSSISNEETVKMISVIATLENGLPILMQVLGVLKPSSREQIIASAEEVLNALPN